ncbi:guanylate kinase, partial [Stackebrandtia soli]|uniref:guanylate kinase n=1 Tax=Stackebrandtia soli TaxID=1892856 RepID=UPI0039E87CFE
TTRSPRPGEIPGFHYHYYDRAHFEKLAADGQFLEWAQYANNFYGTPRAPVEERLARGENAVMEADVQGARQVRKAMPEAQLVFLAPPSWEELERRLKGRGTEDAETIRRRLDLAQDELASESEFDRTIVNYTIEQATEELVSLLGSPSESSSTCSAIHH